MSGNTSDTRWQREFALLVLPAFTLFALGMGRNSHFLFDDGDTNWHIATGRWILAHGAVPATDPFSYTAAGQPWVTHEWLSEVFMALAYNAMGWGGLALLTSLAAAAVAVLLANALRKKMSILGVAVALIMAGALFLPHYLARPHVIALPLLVFWTLALMKAVDQKGMPALWLLPLMAVWANLHGSFIFGLVFTAFFALDAVLTARNQVAALRPSRQDEQSLSLTARAQAWISREFHVFLSREVVTTALHWGAFLVAAVVMAMVTPDGLAGLLYPFHVMSMKDLQSIAEWRPENFQKLSALQVALFATLAICLYRGVRLPAARLGLLLLLLYMALQHMRQEFILAATAPLLLANSFAKPQGSELADFAAPIPYKAMLVPAAVFAVFFLGITAWRLAWHETRTDQTTVPVSALNHVPPELRGKPVFNDYSFGGWLILQGVKPFMDGRSDMYGDDLLRLYIEVNDGDRKAFNTASNRFHMQWTILAPSSPLVKVLDTMPGWHRIYADKWAVVQSRINPAGQ